jgi:hypothetical protein
MKISVKRLTFNQAAAALNVDVEFVRMLVVEEKSLPALYVTLHGIAEQYHYQLLDVDSDGKAYDLSILTVGQFQEGVRSHTGNLRIERDALDKFLAQESLEASTAIETKEQRQDRRLKTCELAGLVMPKSGSGRLPDGIGRVALRDGAKRQPFSSDVKAALKRRERSNPPVATRRIT